MKISKLLATHHAILEQARLANLAQAYLTLRRLAERVRRARLHGFVQLRQPDIAEERFWASLTALEGSQSVLEEHFSDEELMEFADAVAFVRGTNATLSVQGSGAVAGTALANDATGIVGPWARYGTGTGTRYAAVSGGVVVGGVGTAAASAACAGMSPRNARWSAVALAGASMITLRTLVMRLLMTVLFTTVLLIVTPWLSAMCMPPPRPLPRTAALRSPSPAARSFRFWPAAWPRRPPP